MNQTLEVDIILDSIPKSIAKKNAIAAGHVSDEYIPNKRYQPAPNATVGGRKRRVNTTSTTFYYEDFETGEFEDEAPTPKRG